MPKRAPTSKPEHRLFTGSFHPELEAALANEIGECKKQFGVLAPVHILVPSSLLRIYLPRRMAEAFGGHANLRFQTLTDLVRSLAPPDAVPLPTFADELIVTNLVETRVKPDSYFGPVRAGAGFRSALLASVRDLKQADIAPTDLRQAGRALNPAKFDQLADLYAAYQSALKATGFSDEDDLLNGAIRSSGSQLLTPGSRLLLYGFYDFNHLQRELITAMVARVPATVFMPYQESPAFQYAKPTLEWFQQLLDVEAEPVAAPEMPGTLQQLRSGLFQGKDVQQGTEPDPAQIQIISAPGEASETKEILREATKWCQTTSSEESNVGGASARRPALSQESDEPVGAQRRLPHSVCPEKAPCRPLFHAAVIARRADDYAETLRDLATSRGYAIHLHGGRSLLHDVVAQSVLLVPRVVATNFARHVVLEFLSLAPIQIAHVLPATLRAGFLPSTWGTITAEAGIVADAEAWQERLDRWVKARLAERKRAENSGEPVAAHFEQRLLAGRALETFVAAFFKMLSRIPATDARWSSFVTAIEEAARNCLEPSDELEASLACVRGLSALEPIQERVSLATCAEFVEKALAQRTVSESKFEEGGLFVGGLESCRGVSWPMVVVPGLVESAFPRVVREDPILLDQERKAIHSFLGGTPPRLPLKQAGHDEERLLFQLAVESARERLVLTYPRLDPFRGNERVPSIFLLHCIEALRGGTANFASLEHDPLQRIVPLQEIAANSGPLDPQEFDLATIHSALGREVCALVPYLDAVSPWITRGLHCERRRWGTPAFTQFDGVFESSEAKAAIAAWSAGKIWSATAFERFARNPYEFFLNDVLGIEEFEDPEETEGALATQFGALWHAILREVVQQVIAAKSWAAPNASAVAGKHLDEFERTGVTGYPLVWEVSREKLIADVAAWLHNEAEDTSFFPCHVEHPLPATEVLGVTLRGRVDRVDLSRDGEWRVYDYKTSRRVIKAETFDKGRALQIPLYMLALEKANAPTPISSGYYYYVTRAGRLRRSGWSREALADAAPSLQVMIHEIVESIREGRFYLTDQTRDVAGVTMPEAALKKLMAIKQADARWAKLASLMADDAETTVPAESQA